MDVTSDFKRTEVGAIPRDWQVVSLAELLNFRNGVNADKRAYGSGIPFANVLEVITNSHLTAVDIPGRVTLPRGIEAVFFVSFGDLLFNRTSETQNEVGLTAVYIDQAPIVFGGFVIRGRPSGRALDPLYCGYGFRAPSVRSQIIARGQGAIRANIGQADLRAVRAAVPPIKEQRAIAGALREVDALIRALDTLITKKRDLKQATMQQLLTGQTRLAGFGGEWVLKRLGEMAEMRSGGTPLSSVADYYGGDIPWVSIADMTKCGKVILRTEKSLTRLGYANSAARMFPTGTLLYAMYASLGECSVAGRELCTSQAILGIRPKHELDSEFLYYWLASRRAAVRSMGQHGTQANISKGMVEAFELAVPPLGEQRAIAVILCDMDAELAALEARRDKTRALKQGMMQELLTGRIRLV